MVPFRSEPSASGRCRCRRRTEKSAAGNPTRQSPELWGRTRRSLATVPTAFVGGKDRSAVNSTHRGILILQAGSGRCDIRNAGALRIAERVRQSIASSRVRLLRESRCVAVALDAIAVRTRKPLKRSDVDCFHHGLVISADEIGSRSESTNKLRQSPVIEPKRQIAEPRRVPRTTTAERTSRPRNAANPDGDASWRGTSVSSLARLIGVPCSPSVAGSAHRTPRVERTSPPSL